MINPAGNESRGLIHDDFRGDGLPPGRRVGHGDGEPGAGVVTGDMEGGDDDAGEASQLKALGTPPEAFDAPIEETSLPVSLITPLTDEVETAFGLPLADSFFVGEDVSEDLGDTIYPLSFRLFDLTADSQQRREELNRRIARETAERNTASQNTTQSRAAQTAAPDSRAHSTTDQHLTARDRFASTPSLAIGDDFEVDESSRSARSSSAPLLNYLIGDHDGGIALTPLESLALDLLADTIGDDDLHLLASRLKMSDTAIIDLIESALRYALRDANESTDVEASSAFSSQSRLPVTSSTTLKQDANPARFVGELVAAIRLGSHLDELEHQSGGIVRQAGESVQQFLSSGAATRSSVTLAELVRDLRSGAFLSTAGTTTQFPLTGRARIASEMMAVMRTLDRLERFANRVPNENHRAHETASPPPNPQASIAAARHRPHLPNRAGAFEIDNFMRMLFGGMNSSGNGGNINAAQSTHTPPTLHANDGTPLKPDQLVWLGAAGGILKTFDSESQPASLSSAILNSFDALYSLIGFDGRAPNSPAFLMVQAEVNHSKSDVLFGQAPFTDGWVRALIERLKDSIVAAHNKLGEQLEDSLAQNQFSRFVLSGAIEQGTPIANSFTLAPAKPLRSAAPRLALA